MEYQPKNATFDPWDALWSLSAAAWVIWCYLALHWLQGIAWQKPAKINTIRIA